MCTARPSRTLVLLGTPRVGMRVLVDLLAQSGLRGPDTRTRGVVSQILPGMLAASAGSPYLIHLEAPADLEALVQVAAQETGERGLDAIWSLVGPPAFVWLTRRDKLRQALSWWRAQRTGRWTSLDAVAPAPPLERSAVRAHVRAIVRAEAETGAWLDELGIVPTTLVYEDWTARPTPTLRTLLEQADASRSCIATESRFSRTSDQMEAQWWRALIDEEWGELPRKC